MSVASSRADNAVGSAPAYPQPPQACAAEVHSLAADVKVVTDFGSQTCSADTSSYMPHLPQSGSAQQSVYEHNETGLDSNSLHAARQPPSTRTAYLLALGMAAAVAVTLLNIAVLVSRCGSKGPAGPVSEPQWQRRVLSKPRRMVATVNSPMTQDAVALMATIFLSGVNMWGSTGLVAVYAWCTAADTWRASSSRGRDSFLYARGFSWIAQGYYGAWSLRWTAERWLWPRLARLAAWLPFLYLPAAIMTFLRTTQRSSISLDIFLELLYLLGARDVVWRLTSSLGLTLLPARGLGHTGWGVLDACKVLVIPTRWQGVLQRLLLLPRDTLQAIWSAVTTPRQLWMVLQCAVFWSQWKFVLRTCHAKRQARPLPRAGTPAFEDMAYDMTHQQDVWILVQVDGMLRHMQLQYLLRLCRLDFTHTSWTHFLRSVVTTASARAAARARLRRRLREARDALIDFADMACLLKRTSPHPSLALSEQSGVQRQLATATAEAAGSSSAGLPAQQLASGGPAPPTSSADNPPGMCISCWERPAGIILAPCGHRALCRTCFLQLRSDAAGNSFCPTCRHPVESYIEQLHSLLPDGTEGVCLSCQQRPAGYMAPCGDQVLCRQCFANMPKDTAQKSSCPYCSRLVASFVDRIYEV
ncbi:hypothetical protein WJX72_000171 [[Myrmecia] bisecta]|uniref:RING-type domain-containing protein n=1 Tax=[Myrmecia] bisecta TaxID=41462 RepID=A0AAW1QDX0_9CHLO